MAFASLINGAECGPVNPLSSLKSAYQQDRTLQQDRYLPIAGPSSQPFRSSVKQYPVLDQEATQFYDAQNVGPAFDLAPLDRALSPHQQQHAMPGWAADFSASLPPQASANHVPAWAKDFKKDQQVSRPVLQQNTHLATGSPQRYATPPMYRMQQQVPMNDWSMDMGRQIVDQQAAQENAQMEDAFRQAQEG